MMKKTRHEICALAELQPGQRKLVEIGRRSIGIFNVGGALHAIKNRCPHQGAELCRGILGGTMLPSEKRGEYRYGLDGRVLRCPWHFWEFDVTTGEVIFVPEPRRVKTYDVVVEVVEETAVSRPKLEKFDVAVENKVVVLYL